MSFLYHHFKLVLFQLTVVLKIKKILQLSNELCFFSSLRFVSEIDVINCINFIIFTLTFKKRVGTSSKLSIYLIFWYYNSAWHLLKKNVFHNNDNQEIAVIYTAVFYWFILNAKKWGNKGEKGDNSREADQVNHGRPAKVVVEAVENT